MLDEKTMVADTLAGINGELVRYGRMNPTDQKYAAETGFKAVPQPV